MKTSQVMTNNSQLYFRLKITTLELITKTGIASTESTTTATTPSAIVAEKYTARTIDMFEIDHTNIEYRAEGNANIVLALPQMFQVLRLPKCSRSSQNICHSNTAKEYLQPERIFYVYKYINNVSPLFGPNLSDPAILVRIEFHNVDAFNVWLHRRRPIHRIESNVKDLHFEYGLLYRDACTFIINDDKQRPIQPSNFDSNVVFSVEIKPKQGWNICRLSTALRQLLGIDESGKSKCRFCAMQYLKMKGRTVHEISKYCPMDLFSGVVQRMEYALRNLITFPQNNFRLFINGKLVYTATNRIEDLHDILNGCFPNESRCSLDTFISLLIRILRFDFVLNRDCDRDQISMRTDDLLKSVCMESDPCYLPEHSILNYVLKLQLLIQETISHMAEKYSSFECIQNENWPHLHVHELNRKLNQFKWNRSTQVGYEYLKTKFNLHDEEMYEIGATALDSSIMLTFQKTDQSISPNISSITVDGQTFLISARTFDLDPKLYTTHFNKYITKTRESYQAYRQNRNCDT